jgi:RNA polymerase sigma-70 factor, ECF subfamily
VVVDPQDMEDIEAGLNGDGDAYARLVRRYQPLIARRMWKFCRDEAAHAELVHDVFVQAFFSLKTFKGKAPFEHWLSRIATNVGYKYWKRRKKEEGRLHAPIEELREIAAQDIETIDPMKAADLLEAVLDRLQPRDRLVLTLRYLENRSIEETAQQTGWTKTMVKVQAWRARRKLKTLLEQAGIEAPNG